MPLDIEAAIADRRRRMLAHNEIHRWSSLATAILSVAASARLLRDVTSFAECVDNPSAMEAGRAVEKEINKAILDATGVDLLANIMECGK